jgi:PAS domain S-box-containing protein
MTQTVEKTTKTQSTQRQVPSEIVQKWQEIVDLLAEIMHVPSALVMRVEPPNIKVFVSSKSEGNPYEPDEVASLNTGLYCETVMKTRQPLLVPDALQDEEWKSNPDIKLGMISYLGFPVSWPDGEIFGTICVLDNKKNEYGELYRKFLLQYRDVLQADLRSLATVHAELTTQKAHLEELFARMPEAIVQLDGGGRVARVNPEFTKIFGYAEGEALGRSLNDLIVPEELRAEAEEFTSRVNDRGEIQTVETVRSRKNGTRVPVSIVRVPVMSEGRQISEYAIYGDITERKRAEEAARRSEKALREVIETIPAMVWSALPDGNADFFNQRWQEFTGLSLEKSLGWDWEAPIHPEDVERYVGKWRASIATGQPFEDEVRFRRVADGEYRWFLDIGVPLRDEQGNVLKWYGVVTDIDDRKRGEALLAGEKRILERVARGASLAQILDSLCRLVEEQAQDVLASILLVEGDRLRHGGAPSLPTAYTEAIDGVLIGPSVGSCGTAAYRGELVIVSDIASDPLWADYREAALSHALRACWSTPVFSPEGKVIATFAMYYREPRSPSAREQEIIEPITHLAGVAIQRKLGEEKLRESEERFRNMADTAPVMIWVCGADKLCTYFNQRWLDFTGRAMEEELGNRWREGVHPDDYERCLQTYNSAFDRREPFRMEYRLRRSDGQFRWIDNTGLPRFSPGGEFLGYIGSCIDITERKRAEEALHQAQAELAHVTRVVTMGELASSVAHEVNQPLAGLVTNGQACLRWLARDPPDLAEARACLQRIVRDGTRAGEVIARMLAFARKAAPQPARLALNDVIAEVLALADGELRRHGVALHTDLAAGLPPVWGDRVQLQQVLLNLLLNGVDAMRGVTDRPRALLVRSRKDGAEGVLVAVQDAGPGIALQDLERVFEPFYTTKPTGLGLGLAISRSIIEAHGGRLWAAAQDEQGATFQFTLPIGKANQ